MPEILPQVSAQENTLAAASEKISFIIDSAQAQILSTVNTTMVYSYFQIGKIIVEYEQQGNEKAAYGQYLLRGLSERLTDKYRRGFSKRNLELMRKFYLNFKDRLSSEEQPPVEQGADFAQTVSAQFRLSWSHYVFLLGIPDKQTRDFYEKEASNEHWSLRELKRQFNSALYERLSLSRDKKHVKDLSVRGLVIESAQDIIKDPYILEFLGLPQQAVYSESLLEQRLIDKLQDFLLELGKGFSFVGRQVRISFDEQNFFIDLVFYNRFLRCFVLIDLKIGELTHQDLGQMQMYVNYYDRTIKTAEENPAVGMVLCRKKNNSLVEMILPENNTQIFASQYLTVLPDKEQLIALLDENVENVEDGTKG